MNRLHIATVGLVAIAALGATLSLDLMGMAGETASPEESKQPKSFPSISSSEIGNAAEPPISVSGGDSESVDDASLVEGVAELRLLQEHRDPVTPGGASGEAITETIWTVSEQVADDLPITAAERGDGRAFIEFNRSKLEGLGAGDRLTFPVPQLGRDYTLLINSVDEHEEGILSWSGHIEGAPPNYATSITQGPEYTYGGITTPEGHFTLEVHGDRGWIVPTDAIYTQSEEDPDFLVPSEEDVADPRPLPGG